jgi:HAD superfamily hydrolase (TIGR01509 family)
MCFEKETEYQKVFKSELKLIRGLNNFLHDSYDAGIKLAIGSAAITNNVDFVLDGLQIRKYIDAVVSADNVEESKPHPETFLKCAEALGIDPKDCLVFEDAPKGVESAFNAGMDCVVITTLHKPEEFSTYKNVIGFISNFDDPILRKLIKWKQTV